MRYVRAPNWVGAVARPAGDGWRGHRLWVPTLLPHPLALGALVWQLLHASSPDACFDSLRVHSAGPALEGAVCSETCAPETIRWVYVLGPQGLSVLAAVCFTEGPGLVDPPHHYRHVALGHYPYRGSEPDWAALIRDVLRLKAGPNACPAQRIAV